MNKGSGFQKFFKEKEKSGAAKKEEIRQEKRVVRKEREQSIADAKRQKRAQYKAAAAGPQAPKYNLEPPTSRYQKKDEARPAKKSFTVDRKGGGSPSRPTSDRPQKPFRKDDRTDNRRPQSNTNDRPRPQNRNDERPFEKRSKPSFGDRNKPAQGERNKPSFGERPKPGFGNKNRPSGGDQNKPPYNRDKPSFNQRPKPEDGERRRPADGDRFKPTFNKENRPAQEGRPKPSFGPRKNFESKGRPERREERPMRDRPVRESAEPKSKINSADEMPLNKYIAHSGMCSRRDAVDLVKKGKVKVNGELVLEPGHKVSVSDDVKVQGKKLNPVKDFVYILLNKPKDYITTTEDPQERKTVLDLLQNAPPARIYPVGRLDRNTSGVLLLTNDGDLSQKLTHPSNEIKKVYAVTLDKPLTKHHFEEILKGITLDDGPALVDTLAYADAQDHTQIGVEIHSGRNRIVRRIFEHLGYDVKALDRVIFAGLTKKNVNRGKWRFLSEKEVRDLKFFKKGRS